MKEQINIQCIGPQAWGRNESYFRLTLNRSQRIITAFQWEASRASRMAQYVMMAWEPGGVILRAHAWPELKIEGLSGAWRAPGNWGLAHSEVFTSLPECCGPWMAKETAGLQNAGIKLDRWRGGSGEDSASSRLFQCPLERPRLKPPCEWRRINFTSEFWSISKWRSKLGGKGKLYAPTFDHSTQI